MKTEKSEIISQPISIHNGIFKQKSEVDVSPPDTNFNVERFYSGVTEKKDKHEESSHENNRLINSKINEKTEDMVSDVKVQEYIDSHKNTDQNTYQNNNQIKEESLENNDNDNVENRENNNVEDNNDNDLRNNNDLIHQEVHSKNQHINEKEQLEIVKNKSTENPSTTPITTTNPLDDNLDLNSEEPKQDPIKSIITNKNETTKHAENKNEILEKNDLSDQLKAKDIKETKETKEISVPKKALVKPIIPVKTNNNPNIFGNDDDNSEHNIFNTSMMSARSNTETIKSTDTQNIKTSINKVNNFLNQKSITETKIETKKTTNVNLFDTKETNNSNSTKEDPFAAIINEKNSILVLI